MIPINRADKIREEAPYKLANRGGNIPPVADSAICIGKITPGRIVITKNLDLPIILA
jgi:hypothetical protein